VTDGRWRHGHAATGRQSDPRRLQQPRGPQRDPHRDPVDVLETIHRNYFEAAPTRSRPNTFGCNLSNLGCYDIADKIRELSLEGTAVAKRVGVELGVPDVDRVTT
jgi:hypothetical protein